MTYWTQFWGRFFKFSSLPFYLDRWLLRLPTGWHFTFGFWIRCTVDSPGAPPSAILNNTEGYHCHVPLGWAKAEDLRLLKLHPGNPGDPIRISLIATTSHDAPPYEAISYVWGSDLDHSEIIVDGSRFRITKNLHDAFEALRYPASVRTMWADQVCIDQSNVTERNHQVRKMDMVYGTAKSVVVDLRVPTEQTGTDMQHVQSFLQPHIKGKDAPWSHIAIPDLERSVSNIIGRRWFERMWTVQEAVLARHIVLQCGQYRIQWTADLRTLRALVFRVKSAIVSPLYNLHERNAKELDWMPLLHILESQMRQAARRGGVVSQRNLLDVAFDFRYRRCSDPRDKYLAFLAIIEDDQRRSSGFISDYRMGTEEVYEHFRAAVQQLSEIEDVPLA
ncbi:heterokaryon incompatibility protein-domain-containing protein [Alternaria rosae]|uniref:heterokaryon incompatibility protein-domain-containing protein n=1 Tax=Alternaria rosae TaxID=1187941 RepID=UPI001E8CAEC8|nr:heterokaryon incompatibility protein-domain-containing protein [Alternaria rosae]KAH6865668.1 heterokaryon incompatibility protein-domain-containing protein [Alternaria rosae]